MFFSFYGVMHLSPSMTVFFLGLLINLSPPIAVPFLGLMIYGSFYARVVVQRIRRETKIP
jgi:hypothetical protein